jgi:hypothetical protein
MNIYALHGVLHGRVGCALLLAAAAFSSSVRQALLFEQPCSLRVDHPQGTSADAAAAAAAILSWLGSQVNVTFNDAWAGLMNKCLEARMPQFTYK